jgi:hypothetical protein
MGRGVVGVPGSGVGLLKRSDYRARVHSFGGGGEELLQ